MVFNITNCNWPRVTRTASWMNRKICRGSMKLIQIWYARAVYVYYYLPYVLYKSCNSWWPYPFALGGLGLLLIHQNTQHHSAFRATSRLHLLNWLFINQKNMLQIQGYHRLGPRPELPLSTNNWITSASSCWNKSKTSKPPPKSCGCIFRKRNLKWSWLSVLPIAKYGFALQGTIKRAPGA